MYVHYVTEGSSIAKHNIYSCCYLVISKQTLELDVCQLHAEKYSYIVPVTTKGSQ